MKIIRRILLKLNKLVKTAFRRSFFCTKKAVHNLHDFPVSHVFNFDNTIITHFLSDFTTKVRQKHDKNTTKMRQKIFAYLSTEKEVSYPQK